jgi:hypothetical protein
MDTSRQVGRKSIGVSVIAVLIETFVDRLKSGAALKHRPREIVVIWPDAIQ